MKLETVHLGPEHGIGYLTPADELDEIELGGRADLWLTREQMTRLYTAERDRVMAMTHYLVSSVASTTSWNGLPFPEKWWPPSAGDIPASLTEGRG